MQVMAMFEGDFQPPKGHLGDKNKTALAVPVGLSQNPCQGLLICGQLFAPVIRWG